MTSPLSASDVLRQFGSSLPVNPEAIAAASNIEILAASADPTFADEPYSGRYMRSPSPRIFVDRTQSAVRQRFTVAHELGHHFLGHGDSFRDCASSFSTTAWQPHEVAANRFAAELLMPVEVVRAASNRTTVLSVLAAGFQVSEVAMRFRLQNLGLLSENS